MAIRTVTDDTQCFEHAVYLVEAVRDSRSEGGSEQLCP